MLIDQGTLPCEGLVRPARRPAGWIVPGPPGPPQDLRGVPLALLPGRNEDLCHLSGDWRILQRTDGHRWSLDDLVTAWVATRGTAPARALDLGWVCSRPAFRVRARAFFVSPPRAGRERGSCGAAASRFSFPLFLSACAFSLTLTG